MGIEEGRIKENNGIHGESFSLPEEMKIVTPMTERKEPNFDADPFLQVDKWAPETPEETPTDLAHQHDHYTSMGWRRKLFQRRPDKDWSLTDCLSFVVMKDRGITKAFTTDHHFEQAGFEKLI